MVLRNFLFFFTGVEHDVHDGDAVAPTLTSDGGVEDDSLLSFSFAGDLSAQLEAAGLGSIDSDMAALPANAAMDYASGIDFDFNYESHPFEEAFDI